jgi:hypothetical protein
MTHAFLLAAMVMIRTYNYLPVPPDDLARARVTADRTFEEAGISLQWVDCGVPEDRPSAIGHRPSSIVHRPSSIGHRPSASASSSSLSESYLRTAIIEREAACAQPLREGIDFVLRLVPSPVDESHSSSRIVAMGTSLINRDSRAGALTTVDAALVLKIARGSGVDFGTLLGRAIAHEIGHLLLGHSRHSRDGLMRAIWSQDEIRGIRTAGWQFSAAEAAEMRQGIAARSRSAN